MAATAQASRRWWRSAACGATDALLTTATNSADAKHPAGRRPCQPPRALRLLELCVPPHDFPPCPERHLCGQSYKATLRKPLVRCGGPPPPPPPQTEAYSTRRQSPPPAGLTHAAAAVARSSRTRLQRAPSPTAGSTLGTRRTQSVGPQSALAASPHMVLALQRQTHKASARFANQNQFSPLATFTLNLTPNARRSKPIGILSWQPTIPLLAKQQQP